MSPAQQSPGLLRIRYQIARPVSYCPWILFLSSCLCSHSDDHIALFVSLLDIAVRFHHLLKGIAAVDDRFELARLNQLFEEDKIFDLLKPVAANFTFLLPRFAVHNT